MLLNQNFLNIKHIISYFDEDDKQKRIDHICHLTSEQIHLYSGQPHFKQLAEFAQCLLFFIVIHIVRAYLVQAERSALMVAIT